MSLIQGLHPLTKLGWTLALVVLAFLLPPIGTWSVVTVLALLAWREGQGRQFLWGMGVFGWSLAIAVAVLALVEPGSSEAAHWAWGPLRWGPEQVTWFVTMLGRIVLLLAAVYFFILSTRPEDLYMALVKLGASRLISYGLTAAVSFIPHLRGRINSVREAQMSRGVQFGRSHPRSTMALIAPLFLSALEEAAEREVALVIRGFGFPGPPTFVREVSWKKLDSGVLVLAVVAVGVGISWRVFGG